jgi:catechol 2,3-dioxygenase-like lactoylglutathione lyase family enzyme
MQPLRILETALYVDDLQKAEKFYTDVLGLAINSKHEGRHVFFHCGGGMLLLFNATESVKKSGGVPPHGTSGNGHVAFSIESDTFDTWRAHLQSHNIKIEAEIDWPRGGHSIYVRDPSGNSIEFTTTLTWSA